MSKVYVIKNKKNGKYKTDYGDDCTDLLYANFIEEEYKQYEKLYEDEYWQEVTLAEGDLEKELVVRDIALELASDKVKSMNENMMLNFECNEDAYFGISEETKWKDDYMGFYLNEAIKKLEGEKDDKENA